MSLNGYTGPGTDTLAGMNRADFEGVRVLVTGATGFTGKALTRRLAELGAIVHAVARPESDRSALKHLPIQWSIGQIFDPDVVKQATEGVAYIFHMATTYRHAAASDELNHQVHVTSTELLAKAVTGRPEFRRFVHVSTIGVHGHIEHPPGNEDSPFGADDIYQRTKAEAELWIRDYAKQSGLPLTVLRPCGLYGPEEERFLKFFKMATHRVMFALGKKGCELHLVHVDDFVGMALRAAVHPAALNEVFICGSPTSISLEDFAALIAKELGHKLTFIRLPALPVYALGYLCELVFKPFGIDPPLHRRRVSFYMKHRSFDTSKIRNRLGYVCAFPDEVGIPLTTRWYVDHGWLKTGRNR